MNALEPPSPLTLAAWSRHLAEPVEPLLLLEQLSHGSLPRAFAGAAAEAGDRPALTIGGATATHTELDRLAASVGGWLVANGVRPGDRILLAGMTSQEFVGAYLGTLRCGATTLPIEEAATEDELAQVIAGSGAVAAFADGAAADRIMGLQAGHRPRLLVGLDATATATAAIPFAEVASGTAIPPAGAGAPAILAFTSGTTGQPKGVPLSHANVLASIRAAMLAWSWVRDDVLVHALPLSHQHGLGGLHATLLAGSHAVIEPRFDPERFCALLVERRASVIMAVPTIYDRLSEWQGIGSAGMERLRLAISGSAPMSADSARRAAQWLGRLPLERYGSTEAGLVLSNPYGEERPGSVGYPLPGAEVRLLDPAGGEVEAGADGELVSRGPQVFSGYLDRPEETAEAFTADGWFRSGDIARVDPDTGSFAITGRLKEMIISGGLNVFPREVETVLDEHPSVLRSAVAGLSSERWGEEVVAFVVPAPGSELDPGAVLEHCRERLSVFKCPKRVLALAELPVNEMGKVRRGELVSIASAAEVPNQTEVRN